MPALVATRATLAALSGGASLDAALLVGSKAADRTRARAFEGATTEVVNEAFRREAVERVPLEPPAVKVLLGRGRLEAMTETARLAFAAGSPERRARRTWMYPLAIVSTGVVVLGVCLLIRFWVSGDRGLGIVATRVEIAAALALLGLVITTANIMVRRVPRLPVIAEILLFATIVFWAPALWLLLIGEYFSEHRTPPPLDTRRLLLWLAAGEAAGVVPGAVVAGLLKGALPFADRFRLARFERRLRGVTNAREAAVVWAKLTKDRALERAASVDLDDGDGVRTVERLAILGGTRSRPSLWEVASDHAGLLLIAAGAFLLVFEIMFRVMLLGAHHVVG